MDYEEINEFLFNLIIVISLFIIITVLFLIFSENKDFIKKLIISLIILLIILLILFLLIITLNNILLDNDNLLLTNDFVFSTKIFNNDNLLTTYPNKSILNLYYDYGIYRVNENIDIEYNNLTNNYSFKNNNKIINSQKLFNLTKELYYQYINDNNYLITKYRLNYNYYNKSYMFDINNTIYIINEYDNDKYCIFKQTKQTVLDEINNTTIEVIKYVPLCILYNSYIYGYYRLCDLENNEVLCKLYSIGPEYIYDVNINKYYTIYGKYSNNLELSQNKMMKIKIYLSMLLPLSFSTKLKITNYNNNFK